MTNSFSVINDELPQVFIHHYFQQHFQNVSLLNGNIIVKENNMKVTILVVPNCTTEYPIMNMDGTESNQPSFYTLFNVGEYFNGTSMVESCCNYIGGKYIIMSSMEDKFLNRVELLKTHTEVILSCNEHANQINIRKLFFTR